MKDYEHYGDDHDDHDDHEAHEGWESEASRRATAIHLAIGLALCIGMTASTVYWVVTWYI